MTHIIVPVEPTEEMIAAANILPITKQIDSAVMLSYVHGAKVVRDDDELPLQQWYRAMLTARPAIPDAVVERVERAIYAACVAFSRDQAQLAARAALNALTLRSPRMAKIPPV